MLYKEEILILKLKVIDFSDIKIEQSHLNREIQTNRHYLDTITKPEQYKEITLIV